MGKLSSKRKCSAPWLFKPKRMRCLTSGAGSMKVAVSIYIPISRWGWGWYIQHTTPLPDIAKLMDCTVHDGPCSGNGWTARSVQWALLLKATQADQADSPGKQGRPGTQVRQTGQAGTPGRQAMQADQAGRSSRQAAAQYVLF